MGFFTSDHEPIEEKIKARGGKDVASRVDPFAGSRNYEVTYRDSNGEKRVTYCHIDLRGRIYFSDESK